MNRKAVFSIEAGKVILGTLIDGSPIGTAVGKGVGDVVEFAAKKVDLEIGHKNIEYNPLNLIESAEVLIRQIFNKKPNIKNI